MQMERFRDRFRDAIGLIVTPTDRSYAIDESALRAHIDWCIAQGATGIVAGGSTALGALGMTKATASVVTGIDMGPARPPYLGPDDAEERLTKRLPELYEIVPAMRPGRRTTLHPVS